MNTSGVIAVIGEVKDGSRLFAGPTQPTTLLIEVGPGTGPSVIQSDLEITQDAALELVAKLTLFLKARGCL